MPTPCRSARQRNCDTTHTWPAWWGGSECPHLPCSHGHCRCLPALPHTLPCASQPQDSTRSYYAHHSVLPQHLHRRQLLRSWWACHRRHHRHHHTPRMRLAHYCWSHCQAVQTCCCPMHTPVSSVSRVEGSLHHEELELHSPHNTFPLVVTATECCQPQHTACAFPKQSPNPATAVNHGTNAAFGFLGLLPAFADSERVETKSPRT